MKNTYIVTVAGEVHTVFADSIKISSGMLQFLEEKQEPDIGWKYSEVFKAINTKYVDEITIK